MSSRSRRYKPPVPWREISYFAVPAAIFWALLIHDRLVSGQCKHGARAHESASISAAGPAQQHTHAH